MRTRLFSILGIILLFAHGPGCKQKVQEDQKGSLTYYSKAGPIGQVFGVYKNDPRLKKVAVVNLETGVLAAYSKPGQKWTFYEVDGEVKRTAEDPKQFTFLRDAKGEVRVELGDARMQLQRSKDTFGLLIIDGLNADAIPVHLLSREAVALYRERLEVDGILVFHITSRLIDFEPVLARIAADAKLIAYSRKHAPSDNEKKLGARDSHWLVMASLDADLAPLLKTGSWQPARTKAGSKVWTDDFWDVNEVLRKGD